MPGSHYVVASGGIPMSRTREYFVILLSLALSAVICAENNCVNTVMFKFVFPEPSLTVCLSLDNTGN